MVVPGPAPAQLRAEPVLGIVRAAESERGAGDTESEAVRVCVPECLGGDGMEWGGRTALCAQPTLSRG